MNPVVQITFSEIDGVDIQTSPKKHINFQKFLLFRFINSLFRQYHPNQIDRIKTGILKNLNIYKKISRVKT